MRRLLNVGAPGDRPSYREQLRGIGALLDARNCHATVITEVEGGILVRANRIGSRLPEIFEFLDGDSLPVEPAPPAPARRPLFPSGYAPFLEALGDRLDRRGATSISIVEGTDFVTVSGFAPIPVAEGKPLYEVIDLLLLAEDIGLLVERGLQPAHRDRSPGAAGARASAEPALAEREKVTARGSVLASFARVFNFMRPQTSRMRG